MSIQELLSQYNQLQAQRSGIYKQYEAQIAPLKQQLESQVAPLDEQMKKIKAQLKAQGVKDAETATHEGCGGQFVFGIEPGTDRCLSCGKQGEGQLRYDKEGNPHASFIADDPSWG